MGPRSTWILQLLNEVCDESQRIQTKKIYAVNAEILFPHVCRKISKLFLSKLASTPSPLDKLVLLSNINNNVLVRRKKQVPWWYGTMSPFYHFFLVGASLKSLSKVLKLWFEIGKIWKIYFQDKSLGFFLI